MEAAEKLWACQHGHAVHRCHMRVVLCYLLHDPAQRLQVIHILKDVFVEGTRLSVCLNVSPASKDFCDETLQLLEQMSLPQKLGSAGTQR